MLVSRTHQKLTMLKPESSLSPSSSSELEIISFSAVSGKIGSSVKPVVDIPLIRGLWPAVTRLGPPQTHSMMLWTGPSSPRSIKSSVEPSAAGGETAPHPGNKDKSCEREKKPEFGVGSRVSSFYLTTSSRKISYDVGDCLARTGNIRAENLSNVLLSGETGWTHRTDESE